jgi:hypothetical protein
MSPQSSLEAAEMYVSQGLVVVPIPYGSKAPKTPDWQHQSIDDVAKAKAIFATPYNIGLNHKLSGTCCLDIDDDPASREVFTAIGLDLETYLNAPTPKIRGMKGTKPVFKMPKGITLPTHKLAWPYVEDGKRKAHVVFELRGDGGQDVLPPSKHPDGPHYAWVDDYPSSYDDFAELPSELLNLWQKWEFYLPIMQGVSPYFKPPKFERRTNTEALTIIERYNESVDIRDLLESYGYRRKGKKFVAPGSSTGLAGVAILESEGKQVVYSHHGSDVLADGHSHDVFDVMRLLECDGDFKKAMDKARAHLGLPAFEASRQSNFVTVDVGDSSPSTHSSLNSLNSYSGKDETFSLIEADKFPELDGAAYHGLAGEIVKTIEPQTEAHPIGLLISFFVAVGIALGNQFHWNVGGTQHPLRFFAVLMGLSSKGRKGTSYGAIYPILKAGFGEAFTKQNVTTGLSSGEGLIYAVRDEVTILETNKKTGEVEERSLDGGIVDKRLIVQEPEFGRVLKAMGREGNTLSAVLRQAWDVGEHQVLRVMTKQSTTATGAHVGIIGHITKDELLRYLEDTETANGFANRFLWVMVKRTKYLPFGGKPDAAVIENLGRQLAEVLEWAKQENYTTLSWSTEAASMWEKVYPQLSEGGHGLSGAVTSRAEAQVLRLAGMYAVLDKSRIVQPQHLEAALAVWEYVEASVLGVFGNKTGDTVADTILEALQKQGQLTRSEVSNLFQRNVNATRINTAVSLLVREGRATIAKGESKNKGKAPEILKLVRHG